jgi:hypothetical protein
MAPGQEEEERITLQEAAARLQRLQGERAASEAAPESLGQQEEPSESVGGGDTTSGQSNTGSRKNPVLSSNMANRSIIASSHNVTVHQDADDMFASSVQVAAPTDSGMCEYPRALRGSDVKTLGRAKEAATKAPKLLYDLPSYYNTGNFEVEQQEQSSSTVGAEAMKMALIGVAYRNAEMMQHIENHDMVNGMLVSHLNDRHGATPKD